MVDILAWVNGETDEAESIAVLQNLVNTGQAWFLEGSVGRMAMDAIEAGVVVLGPVGHRDYWGNYVPSRFEVQPGTKGSPEYAHVMSGHGQHRDERGHFVACPFKGA